jgi:hypothetical protein
MATSQGERMIVTGTRSRKLLTRVLVGTLVGALLTVCCIGPSLFSLISYYGWRSFDGPHGINMKIKGDWSLTVEESGEVAWILDADGEPLFKGIDDVGRPNVHGNSAEYLLRHLSGYELVEAINKGSDDLCALYEARYRDTATGEIVTMYLIEYYYYSGIEDSYSGVITFYSVSDWVGWYEVRMMVGFRSFSF